MMTIPLGWAKMLVRRNAFPPKCIEKGRIGEFGKNGKGQIRA